VSEQSEVRIEYYLEDQCHQVEGGTFDFQGKPILSYDTIFGDMSSVGPGDIITLADKNMVKSHYRVTVRNHNRKTNVYKVKLVPLPDDLMGVDSAEYKFLCDPLGEQGG
jgi:sortase (surface protein transpeptidase)